MAVPSDSSRLVAVTGASGHAGANLVRALLHRGHRVRALVRESRRGLAGQAVEIVAGDVRDGRTLAAAFAGVDTVFHLAAKLAVGAAAGSPLHAVNVEGTRNVVTACVAAGVRRLVHFSSIEACARQPGGTLDEQCPLVPPGQGRPDSYERTKADADRIVLGAADSLDSVLLHPTAILGPCDFQPSPMGEVLLALARGHMPALVSGADCDFVDARDVAAAAIAAAEVGRRGDRYLVSGTRLSLCELARRWGAVTGRSAPRLAAPMWLARLAAPFAPAWARLRGRRPLFTPESLRVLRDFPRVDRGKAERELGYRPRPLDETLRDTWAWLRQEGRA